MVSFVLLCALMLIPVPAPPDAEVFASLEWCIERYRICLLLLFGSVAALTLVKQKQVALVQTITALALFVLFRFDSTQWSNTALTVGIPAVLILLLRILPLDRAGMRMGIVLATTALFPVLTFTQLGLSEFNGYLALSVGGSLLCFMYSATVLGERGKTKSWHELIRPFTLSLYTTGPVSVEDSSTQDRSLGILLQGLSWIALGLAFRWLVSFWSIDMYPSSSIALLRHGELAQGLLQALEVWVLMTLQLAGLLFLDCGIWRSLGMHVPAPLNRPWLATSFIEYWRRTNVLRYHMLRRVYFEPFQALRGPGILAVVMGIFMISSLHHNEGGYYPWHFARWALAGITTALNLWYLHVRSARRIEAYLAGTRPSPRGLWMDRLITVGSLLIIVIIHGLLLQMDWHTPLSGPLPILAE